MGKPATSRSDIEIGLAIHHKNVEAVLAMGPIGPGDAVDVVAAVAKATKGAPEIMAIDQNDAIAKRFPGFESIEVPDGAFKGRPPTPDDSVKSLAVSFRLVSWKRAPAHTSIRFILHGLKAGDVETAFRDHASNLNDDETIAGIRALALDGNALKNSFDAFNDAKARQVLSAFATV